MTDHESLSFAHFTLEKLADGVYAAMAGAGRGAVSNAGILALGDAALVFDTMLTAQAGADLREAAEQLSNSPVRYVVNSHRHADHVMGNSAFPADVQVLSTTLTRDLLLKHIPEFVRTLRQSRAQLEIDLRAGQEQLAATLDPAERAAINETLKANSLQLEAATRARLRAPNWTFEQQIALYGSERAVELISYGPGHTESDAILWLPEERIAFVADLLFNGSHAWAGDGDPAAWQSSLDRILALEPRLVVPGHGPLATADDLVAQKAYMGMLEDVVKEAIEQGLPVDGETPIEVPPEYAHLGTPERFARNVKALVDRARKEKKMILESGLLNVKTGQGDAFAAAFREASPIIRSMPGYIRHELQRGIEAPDRFLLLVWWETLEAHTVGFRGSPEYQEWRARLHHFYDPFPTIEHFTQVDLTPPEESAG